MPLRAICNLHVSLFNRKLVLYSFKNPITRQHSTAPGALLQRHLFSYEWMKVKICMRMCFFAKYFSRKFRQNLKNFIIHNISLPSLIMTRYYHHLISLIMFLNKFNIFIQFKFFFVIIRKFDSFLFFWVRKTKRSGRRKKVRRWRRRWRRSCFKLLVSPTPKIL